MEIVQIETTGREQLPDVADGVPEIISRKRWTDGVAALFCPRASSTCSENVDPAELHGPVMQHRKLVPRGGEDSQHVGGNSAARIKPSRIGPSVQGNVENRKLLLGAWLASSSASSTVPTPGPPG